MCLEINLPILHRVTNKLILCTRPNLPINLLFILLSHSEMEVLSIYVTLM